MLKFLPVDRINQWIYFHGCGCSGVEVRSYEQKIHVQAIRTNGMKFIASSKNTLIATQGDVYKLEPRPYDGQILNCIDQKQFELALCLAVSVPCMTFTTVCGVCARACVRGVYVGGWVNLCVCVYVLEVSQECYLYVLV